SLDGTTYRSRSIIDALGRTVATFLPDGTTREFVYDPLGHVSETRVTTADGTLNRKLIASNIETNARGQRTHALLGHGGESTQEFDPETFRLQRLSAYRSSGPARNYLDIEYTHDPVGNITRWIDRAQDPGSATPLLTGLTVSSASAFTYDAC